MTFDEIAEIEACANGATDGPWKMHKTEFGYCFAQTTKDVVAYVEHEPDNAFIVHSRTDIPRLCAALREAMADAARLREGLEAALPYVSEYFVEKHDLGAALEGREPHEEKKP